MINIFLILFYFSEEQKPPFSSYGEVIYALLMRKTIYLKFTFFFFFFLKFCSTITTKQIMFFISITEKVNPFIFVLLLNK